jgi:hypothetical protein
MTIENILAWFKFTAFLGALYFLGYYIAHKIISSKKWYIRGLVFFGLAVFTYFFGSGLAVPIFCSLVVYIDKCDIVPMIITLILAAAFVVTGIAFSAIDFLRRKSL